jgi:predicted Zn finger-like uncharacterized protein
MTDSFVTQCPHCQTSFRVSHAQLSIARGVVRCGACLQVFNAAKQLLEQRAGIVEAQALQARQPDPLAAVAPLSAPVLPVVPVIQPAAQQPATSYKASDAWSDTEMDLDSMDLDDLDEELARLEQREIQLSESFGRQNTRNDDSALTAHRDSQQGDGEEWSGNLRNDDVSHLPELRAEVIPDTEPEPEQAAQHEYDPEQGRHDRTEPSLSMDAAPDDDDEPMAPIQSLRKPPKTEKNGRWSALDDDDLDEPLPEPAFKPEPRAKRTRGRNEPAVREQTLLDLTDDPLQLEWQRPKSNWGRRLTWTILTLLALAGLAGQYVWYHFDELARQDQYRPWFQSICPQIDCKVPSKVDITLLKSSNLVVRSHPEFKGALVVDAIIYNRASFSQPFPLLELRFADTNGQLIASRRFKPGEYLSGEMAGKEEMPPQTPIHIALDILDPGAKAVNYSLSFRSPE